MNVNEKATVPLPAATDERATVPLPGGDASTVGPTDAPKTLGRFVVRGWVGSGAFGDVYRAHDPQLDREVALKVAKPGSLNTPERLARFLREAKAAANLRHPHIVPLYETGTDGERRFIASAFIAGQTLEALLAGGLSPSPLEGEGLGVRGSEPTGLPLTQLADLARKLADALAYAHSQGVVHRDVKPANVLVDAAGEPHLLDFGLAAREEAGAERLTQDGQGMGTPAFMAPEQAEGKGIAASDQYSLGCTLYELATGQTPFAGGSAQQMFLHRTQPVPSPRSVRKDIPKDLDTLILKCLEKEPARRYPNCTELADDLRRFSSGEPVKARRAGPVERFTRWAKRNKRLAGMGALVLLTMALGTGFSLGFGLYANEQAGIAKDETKKKENEAKRANDETAKAVAAAAGEKREKESAQQSLVKAILTPIGRKDVPLNEDEQNALWELVALRGGPLPPLLLKSATEDELAAGQFRSRAAHLYHAAVGLDARLRRQADGWLAERLADPATPDGLKRHLAFTAVGVDQEVVEPTAAVFAAGLEQELNKQEREALAVGLATVARRVPAERAAELLTAALRSATEVDERQILYSALGSAARRLPAERAAAALLPALETATDQRSQQDIAREVILAAERLPADRRRTVLEAALGRAKSAEERRQFAFALVSHGPRFPDEAADLGGKLANELLASLERANDAPERRSLAAALSGLSTLLPADRAEKVCGRATEMMSMALGKATTVGDRYNLAEGLAVVAVRLPADRGTDVLADELARAADRGTRLALANGLAKSAVRLPADKAVAVLTAALGKVTEGGVRRPLAVGLAAASARLPEEERVRVCGNAAAELATALGAKGGERGELAEGLVAVAGRLPPDRAVGVLSAALGTATTAVERLDLVRGLMAAAGRLPADDAAAVYRTAADRMAAALKAAATPYERYSLATGLTEAASRLPADAGAELLAPFLGKSVDAGERRALAEGLAAAAVRLPADKRAEVCGRAADQLAVAFRSAVVVYDRVSAVEGLMAVAVGLPAERRTEVLTMALAEAAGEYAGQSVTGGLVGLGSGLTPGQRVRLNRRPELAALAGVVTLHPEVLPRPRPLPPEQLVELLKHPFCVKEARRAVLDALEFTYDRKFADLWEFVAFAEKEHPELDLLTPPKRPEKVVPKK